MKFIREWLARRQRKKWLAKADLLKSEYELYKWGYGARVPDSISEVFTRRHKKLKGELDQMMLDRASGNE